MPYKDPEQQREYQRRWIAERRAEWFNGKVCAICGSDDRLELDHIYSARKVSHRIWSWAKARREAELAKCWALCHDCHVAKSNREHAKGEANGQSKLTEAEVLVIKMSGLPSRELVRKTGTSMRNVQRIRKGDTWIHIGVS